MFLPSYQAKSRPNESGGGSHGEIYPFLKPPKTKVGADGEFSKLAIGIKDLADSEFNKTDVGYFDPKKYRIVDPALALLGKKEYIKKSLKCGRVRFDNMLVPAEAEKELICEECEKNYSILRCDACEQVMCATCADICHPRSTTTKKLHNHELRNKIRPLNAKDRSKINKFLSFVLPSCDVFEDDYMLLRDLTKPGTLLGAKSPEKSNQIHKLPRFQARDKCIFLDPKTGKDSYGKVISDWQFVHGEVAPSITRGYDEKNKTGNWYIVLCLGAIDKVDNIDTILKLDVVPPEPPQYPVLEGLDTVPYRDEYKLARSINAKVDLQMIKKPKGAAKHFISEKDEAEMTLQGDYYFTLPKIEERSRPKVEVSKGLDGNELKLQSSSWAQTQTVDRALGYSEVYASENPDYYKDPEYIQRAMNVLILPECDMVRPEEKLEVLSKAKFAAIDNILEKIFFKLTYRLMAQGFLRWKGRMGALREYQIFFSARKIQAHWRRFKCSDTLERKREEYEVERVANIKKYHSQFHYCAEDTPFSKTMDSKIYFRTTTYANRYYFLLRKNMVKVVKLVDKKRRFILRSACQRWRNYLLNMKNSIQKVGHFDHHTIDVDDFGDSATGDEQARGDFTASMIKNHQRIYNKKMWEGAFDDLSYDNVASMALAVNRDFGVLRKEEKEKNRSGSPNARLDSPDGRPGSPDIENSRPSTNQDTSRPGTSGTQGSRATSKPGSPEIGKPRLAKKRIKEVLNENPPIDPPPFHPRVGIKDLPPLKNIPNMKTAQERLMYMQDREKRLLYCSYKAYHEGPTDDSCWVIPGKLLIGKCPHKKMFRNSDVIQLSAIIGVGVNAVISLMESDEEEDMTNDLGMADTIEKQMSTALFNCKAAQGRSILENEAVILDLKEHLAKIPTYYKMDPRYEQAHREKLRLKSRINTAQMAIDKAKAHQKLVPETVDFLRLPIKVDAVPTMHNLLLYLWEIENRIAQGQVVFLYSKEGHGRVGLVAASLLGRLYGLTSHEALFRVQNSHDSQKCEEPKNRPVTVHCPQLMIQRKLVEEVISHTNRMFDGVIWRSHEDPETLNSQLVQISRGHEKGLVGRKDHDPSSRQKISVRFGIDLVKDTSLPPTLRDDGEYKALEDSKPSIDELFARELRTQLKNVVCYPDEVRRKDMTEGKQTSADQLVALQRRGIESNGSARARRDSALKPALPLIRTANEVRPQSPL